MTPVALLPFACAAAVSLLSGRSLASDAPAKARQGVVRSEALPKRLTGVDVKERLGQTLPKQIGFVDSVGEPVMLGDYFDGTLPVIVTLNYSDCPMLCSMILNGLVDSMKKVDLTLGVDYRVVTVSINPNEKPERANATRNRYLASYGRPESRNGWAVLTGSEGNIHAVADAIGFEYGYNEQRDEYVHPSAFVVASPTGMIARYMYGIEYHPKTLRLGLVEASEGKVGSTLDRLLLYCFHYDESEGRYAPVAMNIMRIAGGLCVVLLGGFLSLMWRVDAKKKRLMKGAALVQSSASGAMS